MELSVMSLIMGHNYSSKSPILIQVNAEYPTRSEGVQIGLE